MTPDTVAPVWETDAAVLPVIVAAAIAAVACVGLHAEVVCRLAAWGDATKRSLRLVLPSCVLVLLATHIVQVHIFALVHFVVEKIYGERVGILSMAADGSLTERIYFSGVVFSTLGFGDIVPFGPLRLLVAVESITGLMLIAWSATLTYGVLERANFSPLAKREAERSSGRR
ncbi:MAG: two pore domain potassium channel family protein [Phycisphaerales bacterium]|nr:two pore domain potassium channel family protein [Phycisphaerales bacterium]